MSLECLKMGDTGIKEVNLEQAQKIDTKSVQK